MQSIIGNNMLVPQITSGAIGTMTFKRDVGWEDDFVEVWEFKDEEFEKFKSWATKYSDEEWHKEFSSSWYRYASGSVLGIPSTEFTINGKSIKVWPGPDRDEGYPDEYDDEDAEEYESYDAWEDMWHPREYSDIFEYLSEEMGVSQPKNVCALLADIATYNDMTLAEVLSNYTSR
jgi:hypothetical protein